jgi:hypothetical protein
LATKQEEADARAEVERQRQERRRIEAQAAQAKAQADAEAKAAKAQADAEAKVAKAKADAEAKIAKAKAEADAKAAREEQSRADKARAEAEKVAKAEAKAQAEAEASKPKAGKPKQPKVKAPKPLSAAELREAEDLRALEEAQAKAKAEVEEANAKALEGIKQGKMSQDFKALMVAGLGGEWNVWKWRTLLEYIAVAMEAGPKRKAENPELVGATILGRPILLVNLEKAGKKVEAELGRDTALVEKFIADHGVTYDGWLKSDDGKETLSKAVEGIKQKIEDPAGRTLQLFGEDLDRWNGDELRRAFRWWTSRLESTGAGRQHKPFLYSRPDMTPNEKAKERAQHYRTLKQVAANAYIHVPGAPRTTAHFDAEGNLAKEGRPKLVFLTKEQMETEAARGLNPSKETLPKENSERKPYVGAKMKREFLKTHTAEELKVATKKYKEGGVSWESLL